MDAVSEPRRMRMEVLVATPPTRKCKLIIEALTAEVERHPDVTRLDVYYAGSEASVRPTDGYVNLGKHKKVPSAYVNGRVVAAREPPESDQLRAIVEEEIGRGAEAWQR